MTQKVKLFVRCLICNKSIVKEVDYDKANDKSLIDIFKDDCYQLQILDMEVDGEGLVLLWGLVCKDCYNKLSGRKVFKEAEKYNKSYNIQSHPTYRNTTKGDSQSSTRGSTSQSLYKGNRSNTFYKKYKK